MNKLAVILPIWKRYALTSLVLERLRDQSVTFGFDVYVAGSEGDVSKELSKGLNYIECDNLPVGNKLNALIQQTKSKGYNGVILMGSDDFLSDDLIMFYQRADLKSKVFYSLDTVYFIDITTMKAGMLKNYTTGVGRCFSMPLLEALDFILWSEISKGLDNDSKLKCLEVGEQIILSGFVAVDVKHKDNINAAKKIMHLCEPSDVDLSSYLEIVKNLKPMVKNNKTEVEMLINIKPRFKVGQIVSFPNRLAAELIREGSAKEVETVEPTKPKKPVVKRQTKAK